MFFHLSLFEDDLTRPVGASGKSMIVPGPQRAQIQVVVENAGFYAFYSALIRVMDLTDRFFTYRVVESSWDVTNTFHLPFGEMTITLFDFAVLTVLSFTRESLVY